MITNKLYALVEEKTIVRRKGYFYEMTCYAYEAIKFPVDRARVAIEVRGKINFERGVL
tara:strand:- start:544 stop:717 length:174 start_codon:yes stop_codon:yes gene_type:complete